MSVQKKSTNDVASAVKAVPSAAVRAATVKAATESLTKTVSSVAQQSLRQAEKSVASSTAVAKDAAAHFSASVQQHTAKVNKTMINNFDEINSMMKTQINTAIQSMNIFAKGMEEVSKAVLQFYQNSFENNMAACKSLMACKDAKEVFDIQSNLAKTNLDSLIAEGTKISQMSIETANKAFQPLQSTISQTVESVIKKAA
jgi:phasin family protein